MVADIPKSKFSNKESLTVDPITELKNLSDGIVKPTG